MDGAEHFRLSVNYRIQPVAKGETFLHRRNALPRARQTHCPVSRHLSGRFGAWHSGWVEAHVSPRQRQWCQDWLLGRLEGIKPSRTTVRRDNDLTRPPYVPFNRYRVEWLPTQLPTVDSTAAAAAAAPQAEKSDTTGDE